MSRNRSKSHPPSFCVTIYQYLGGFGLIRLHLSKMDNFLLLFHCIVLNPAALYSHSLRMHQLDLQCTFPVIFPSFTQPVQVVLLIFGHDRMLPVSLFSYPTIYQSVCNFGKCSSLSLLHVLGSHTSTADECWSLPPYRRTGRWHPLSLLLIRICNIFV